LDLFIEDGSNDYSFGTSYLEIFEVFLVSHFSKCHVVKYCILSFPEIQKVLTKLAKEKGCEIIGRWRKSCVRHFYWAVTSTKEHLGELKLAKFEAFLSHVINKHRDLPNRMFNACAHGHITTPRV